MQQMIMMAQKLGITKNMGTPEVMSYSSDMPTVERAFELVVTIFVLKLMAFEDVYEDTYSF